MCDSVYIIPSSLYFINCDIRIQYHNYYHMLQDINISRNLVFSIYCFVSGLLEEAFNHLKFQIISFKVGSSKNIL